MRTAVIAIGGNSLAPAGARSPLAEQRRQLDATCEGVAAVLAAGYEVVLTHGNGPQVGDALLRSELAAAQVEPLPLDACGAETQGSIGYLLQQTLEETLRRRGVSRPIATLVTQVLVSPRDPAFRAPSKPIGPFYSQVEAEERAARLGWRMVEDAGRGFRRVVPSPEPKVILELPAIQAALAGGALVIACGGGGIPVVYEGNRLVGIEAVIDKDRVSALLAWELEAELFLISTGVDQVYLNYGTPQQRPLDVLPLEQARRWLREGQFPPGSMGPKIEAALEYLERGGGQVIITSPARIPEALHGMAGTRMGTGRLAVKRRVA
jgi:carbamate kinase